MGKEEKTERSELRTIEQSQLFRAALVAAVVSLPIPTDKSLDCDHKKENGEKNGEIVKGTAADIKDRWRPIGV